MWAYPAKRLLGLIPRWFALLTLTFLLQLVVPGDPIESLFSEQGTDPQVIASIRHEFGLDQPIYIQYFNYLGNALHGDLGKSYITRRPVVDEVGERYIKTITLAIAALLVAVVLGVGGGVAAVWFQHSLLDLFITGMGFILLSMPGFWLGFLMLDWFSVKLGWVPVITQNDSVQLILPALTLGLLSASFLSRLVKGSLLETLNQDYIRTARAKGLRQSAILLRHALKNAFIPVLTVLGLQFGSLLGGAVVVENVFAWPGLGQLAVRAINQRDYPVIQGLVLLVAATYVIVNTLVDILYIWLDPRFSLAKVKG